MSSVKQSFQSGDLVSKVMFLLLNTLLNEGSSFLPFDKCNSFNFTLLLKQLLTNPDSIYGARDITLLTMVLV